MARTESNMLSLETQAPDFRLIDTISDNYYNLQDLRGEQGTVIMFICNHCPFVLHVNEEIAQIAKEYDNKGIGFIAISSNDIENYPADAPHLMKQHAIDSDFSFPYLYDESQQTALAYQAACTPDFYLFDKNLLLKYRGQLDDSRPGNNIHVSGRDLRNAIEAVINEKAVSEIQKPSIGCNIKWKV